MWGGRWPDGAETPPPQGESSDDPAGRGRVLWGPPFTSPPRFALVLRFPQEEDVSSPRASRPLVWGTAARRLWPGPPPAPSLGGCSLLRGPARRHPFASVPLSLSLQPGAEPRPWLRHVESHGDSLVATAHFTGIASLVTFTSSVTFTLCRNELPSQDRVTVHGEDGPQSVHPFALGGHWSPAPRGRAKTAPRARTRTDTRGHARTRTDTHGHMWTRTDTRGHARTRTDLP